MKQNLQKIRNRTTSLFITVMIFTLLYVPHHFAQKEEKIGHNPSQDFERYDESPDDAYIPVQKSKQKRSPAYKISSSDFFAVQVNVDEFGLNILGDAANEPSLTIDPANPNNMSIGWRQFDSISSNFRQAGYAFSTDAGQTWTFPGCIEPGIFRSDPVLGANN